MAKDLNQCNFIGRLGQDVTTRATPQGKEIATFSLAVNSFKDDDTLWLNVVAWEKLAGICSQYLSKGSKVFISGRLVIRSYEKDGEKKYITELVAENLQMLDSKESSPNQQNKPQNQQQQQNQGSQWGNQNQGQQSGNFNNPPFDPNDSIPF